MEDVRATAGDDVLTDRASSPCTGYSLSEISSLSRSAFVHNPVNLVSQLADEWWFDAAQCYEALAATNLLQIDPHAVRTVALFYFSIGVGGGERVTAAIASLLASSGYNVVLFTDCEPTSDDFSVPDSVRRIVIPGQEKNDYAARCAALAAALRAYSVDAMVYCQWLSHALPWDMLLCKLMNVFFVVYAQSTMRTMFCEADPVDFQLSVAYRYLDGLVVLSETDRSFWEMTVPRVWQTNNPCTLVPGSVPRAELAGSDILWLGRLSEFDKRPSEALRIMALVHEEIPEARLLMVGPAPNEWALKELVDLAEELGIAECVNFVGSTDDVASYYREASVYLLTSRYEGWCLSLAESKAAGVPCVSYDLPYLSLFSGHRGMLVVRQRDRASAAAQIVKLLNDAGLRRRLADDAFRHAQELASFDLREFWQRVLSQVEKGSPARSTTEVNDCMFDTLLGGELESLDKLSTRIRDLESRVADLGGQLEAACKEVEDSYQKVDAVRRDLELAKNEIANKDNRISELIDSTTWKVGSAITWLPRAVKDKVKKQ